MIKGDWKGINIYLKDFGEITLIMLTNKNERYNNKDAKTSKKMVTFPSR